MIRAHLLYVPTRISRWPSSCIGRRQLPNDEPAELACQALCRSARGWCDRVDHRRGERTADADAHEV